MILIKEHDTRKNGYCIYANDNSDDFASTLIREVNVTSATHNYYIILYDSNLAPISPAFEFINSKLANKSPNTKIQAASNLKLLYSYLELFNLDIFELEARDVSNLINFLTGYSPEGAVISFNLKTVRNAKTVNSILSLCRSYVKYLEISSSPLLSVDSRKASNYYSSGDVMITQTPYEHRSKTRKKARVPKYITPEQFEKIINLIRSEYTPREECIIRLMFEGGLRIGEVLGLTAEDLKVEEFTDSRTHKKFSSGVVYIRNRLTDETYQCAKGRIHPKNKRSYKTGMYKDDVMEAYVSVELIDCINDYINDYHTSDIDRRKHIKKSTENPKSNKRSVMSKTKFDDNYSKYVITDIVNPQLYVYDDGTSIEENYYVFINSLGKPLNKNTWNDTLREIFNKCNIHVDADRRRNNLNHRFRHGFAMFLVKYKHINALDLMKLMRHRGLSSTMVYYQPTDDDIAKLHEDFSKTLEDIIPMICGGGILNASRY